MSDLETPQPKRLGVDILYDPRLNKNTGFSEEEREALGLVGMVPEGIDTETTQVQRACSKSTASPPILYLTALLDNDGRCFFVC